MVTTATANPVKCADPFEIAVATDVGNPAVGRCLSLYLDALCSGDGQNIAREGDRLRRVCAAVEGGRALESAGADYGVVEGNRPFADWIAPAVDLWADPMLYTVVPGDVLILRNRVDGWLSEAVVVEATGRHVYADMGFDRFQIDLTGGMDATGAVQGYAWTVQRWMSRHAEARDE